VCVSVSVIRCNQKLSPKTGFSNFFWRNLNKTFPSNNVFKRLKKTFSAITSFDCSDDNGILIDFSPLCALFEVFFLNFHEEFLP